MPAWASTRAIALPIPSVPPVTSAMRRSPGGSLLGFIMCSLWVFGPGQLPGSKATPTLPQSIWLA